MAPRRMDGSWDPDPLKGFTEGGPWTYLFCAMHDVPGLIVLMGGEKEFLKRLDENFNGGYYVHENEPGHHYVYLYDYAGEPWKAQEKAREYCRSKYGSGPAAWRATRTAARCRPGSLSARGDSIRVARGAMIMRSAARLSEGNYIS
jgi:putative alpha-1,2-mannosidase